MWSDPKTHPRRQAHCEKISQKSNAASGSVRRTIKSPFLFATSSVTPLLSFVFQHKIKFPQSLLPLFLLTAITPRQVHSKEETDVNSSPLVTILKIIMIFSGKTKSAMFHNICHVLFLLILILLFSKSKATMTALKFPRNPLMLAIIGDCDFWVVHIFCKRVKIAINWLNMFHPLWK